MKYLMAAIIATALCLSGPAILSAEEEKIGTVDVARTFDGFHKTKEIEKRLEAKGNQKKNEREKYVAEIKRLQGELDLLNEEGRAEKEALIDDKIEALQAFDREVQDSLRLERDQALQDILKEIDDAIAAYAKDKGFKFLMNDRALVYRKKGLDITDDILTELNKDREDKKR